MGFHIIYFTFYQAKNCMSKIQQKQRKVLKSRLFVRVRVRAR